MRLRRLFIKCFRGFLHNQQGTVLIIVAAGIGVTAGIAALAIDMGNAYVLRGQLQRTADAAALAAVSQLPDETAARTEALQYANMNMSSTYHGTVLASSDVSAGNWDRGTQTFTPAGTPVNALRVIAKRSQDNGNAAPTFFAHLLGFDSLDIEVSAVAITESSVCMLALDPTGSGAMKFEGDEEITANGCSIQVNSTDPEAVDMFDNISPIVTTDSTCVTGGIVGPTGGFSPPPETGCSPAADPFASVAPPPVGPCDFTNTMIDGGTADLLPGVYCGGLTVMNNATVTLDPGVYIIKDGRFSVDGTSSVTGAKVTTYLTGNANTFVEFVKDSQVNLSAPTTGPLAGLVFFEERSVTIPRTHFVGSNANLVFEGTLYFPAGKVKVVSRIGGGPSPSPYTGLIAKNFRFSSGAALDLNDDFGGFGGGTALVQ